MFGSIARFGRVTFDATGHFSGGADVRVIMDATSKVGVVVGGNVGVFKRCWGVLVEKLVDVYTCSIGGIMGMAVGIIAFFASQADRIKKMNR